MVLRALAHRRRGSGVLKCAACCYALDEDGLCKEHKMYIGGGALLLIILIVVFFL